MDYTINAQLIHEGLEMPKVNGENFGLYDPKYLGWSVEQVYKDLPDPPENYEPDIKFSSNESNEVSKIEQEVEKILVRANTLEQVKTGNKGVSKNIPGFLRDILIQILEPKVNWTKEVEDYLYNLTPSDYTYRTPNQHYIALPPHPYIPSLGEETICNAVFANDNSYSMTDEQVKFLCSETENFRAIMRPEEFTLLPFTHKLGKPTVLLEGEPVTPEMLMEMGGTEIQPVIDWGIENQPELMIILTDGEFYPYEPEGIDFPILWLIVDNPEFTSNIGDRIIHVELDNGRHLY